MNLSPRLVTALLLLLAACARDPRRPAGSGGGGSGADDDTAVDCVTCELLDCEDETEPDGVESERDCADAASEQGCAEYTFDDDC